MKRKERERRKAREEREEEQVRMECTNCGPFEDWEDNVWIATGWANVATTSEELKKENEVFECPSCGNYQTRGGEKLGHPVSRREKHADEAWGPWQATR